MKHRKWTICLAGCLLLTGCGGQQEAEIPLKTAEEMKQERIAEIIEEMTPEERAGQLLMADFRQNPDGTGMTVLSDAAREAIQTYHLGGVILFAENLDTEEQTKALTAQMQQAAEIPLFIGIDEEGGIVSRLDKSNISHEPIPPAAEITDSRAAGETIGKELQDLGILVDFAPVADVNTNPDNPVIGSRAFSAEPEIAAERVAAFIGGMEETGVSACAKHFPGHGDTAMDSHHGETYVTHDLERLREVEFLPFQAAIGAGVDFIMAGHIKTPQATTDGMPATLSEEMTQLLRKELNFDGILITDAMNMGAITEEYGTEESVVLAIQAGMDIVLMPTDLPRATETLTEAIRNGEISEERVEESLERILSLKYEKGLL